MTLRPDAIWTTRPPHFPGGCLACRVDSFSRRALLFARAGRTYTPGQLNLAVRPRRVDVLYYGRRAR